MIGVDAAGPSIDYFAEFGFRVVAEASLSAEEAKSLYGVDSSASVYRLQNGSIDAHGLLRIIEWEGTTGTWRGLRTTRDCGGQDGRHADRGYCASR